MVTSKRNRVAFLVELVRVANAPAFDLAEDLGLADVEQAPRLVGASVASFVDQYDNAPYDKRTYHRRQR